jgi:hypothetical protein
MPPSLTRLDIETKAYNFSGHASFPLRFAWLTKGCKRICENPAAFRADDRLVKFGVGNNMVEAIAHWGISCQVWSYAKDTKYYSMTDLGQRLLAQDGWDHYLEKFGTYWLLHWNLVTNQRKATMWELIFNRSSTAFTLESITAEAIAECEKQTIRAPSKATLKRDFLTFAKSYLIETSKKKGLIEDEFDCPFKHLGLISGGAEKGELMLNYGAKPTLPSSIFEYALLQFAASEGKQLLSLNHILGALNSPGKVFCLDEMSTMEYLNELSRRDPECYQFDDTNGLRQFVIRNNSEKSNFFNVLASYYCDPNSQENG